MFHLWRVRKGGGRISDRMDKENIYSWIDKRSSLFTFWGLIISLAALVISIILAWEKFGGVIGKMIAIILGIVIIAISFFAVIIFAIGLIRKPLITRLNKKEEELRILTSKFEEETKQLKSKLEDKTKQYDEFIKKYKSGLEKKVQLTDCEINLEEKEKYPKLLITQRFVNMADSPLELSRVEMRARVDDIEIDKFVYNPNNILDCGKKIQVSDMPPLNLGCWIKFKTTKISQVIPDYHGKMVEIVVEGYIEFAVGSVIIHKRVKEREEIGFS